MSRDDRNDQPAVDIDDVISRVYDVALDAGSYEELLDSWEMLNKSSGNKTGAESADPLKLGVASHFKRAVTMLDQLAGSENPDDVSTLLAQFENVAAIVLGKGPTILGANNAATLNFSITANSTLSVLNIEADDLKTLLNQVSSMLAKPEANICIFRVRTVKKGSFLILQMRRTTLRNGDPVVVAATSDIYWPDGFKSVLKDAFNLSSAEIEVVRLLIECCSVKEIAEHRGRSIDTVRAQIKAIMSKTETRSQIELVRLTLSMMDIASNTLDMKTVPQLLSNGIDTLETLPVHTVYNEYGRRLDYLILGDPDGAPILYITAEYSYSRWTASAEADAKRRGIKIISPHRAGYGESDPLPKHAPFCQTVGEDLLTVLDEEGARNIPVVSLSDDHHFATQMEKIRPGTVKAIIATAGGLPFLNRAQVERMHKWYRFIQASARYTPHLLPYMIKMGKYWILKQGRQAFWNAIYVDSPADMKTLCDPEVQEALTVGSETMFSGTHDGVDTFIRQTIFEQEPWLDDHVKWLNGKLPVHFLVGLQDPANPRQTLEEQKVEFPWIDFRDYEDSGQLLLFKHWSDVLDLVEEYI